MKWTSRAARLGDDFAMVMTRELHASQAHPNRRKLFFFFFFFFLFAFFAFFAFMPCLLA